MPSSQTETRQDAYKKLNKKSGNEFGKAYSAMMVSGYKDAIALFEKAATEFADPGIKAWASATIPALKKNLDHSMMCQKQYEKM